jgi:mRNA interferase MazF
VTYERHDVVVVPFPFTDRDTNKRRPALVLSDSEAFNAPTGQVILAMITSASHSAWPHDVEISDLSAAGLTSGSTLRWKLFTLDERLILRRAGHLSLPDADRVSETAKRVLGLQA